MSKEALAKVVQRAISDAGFRRQLNSDPAGALRGFDLSADELSALRTGNAGRLSSLGVDQRMSKAFAIGGAAAATRMAQSDLTAGNPTAFDDGAASARTIIPHDPESTLTADLDGSAASSRSALNDDPDGFLAANADATGGAAARASAINDDPDGFLAANKNADFSGGTAGETAFVDDSEGYLTKVGYDPNVATSAVTDAHDRGDGASITAVTDAHDRGDVTRIADDADGGATSAASEGGPNISS